MQYGSLYPTLVGSLQPCLGLGGGLSSSRRRMGAAVRKARSRLDTGIRKLIEAWIDEQKQKLAGGKNPK